MSAQTSDRLDALERKERQRSFFDRRSVLYADGYGAYFVSEDYKDATKAACKTCGLRGLRYSGLARFLPSFSYIRFFACRRCGTWEEL